MPTTQPNTALSTDDRDRLDRNAYLAVADEHSGIIAGAWDALMTRYFDRHPRRVLRSIDKMVRQDRHGRTAWFFLVPMYAIALSLPFWAPMLAPSMSLDEYSMMVAAVSGVGIIMLVMGMVYLGLSVGTRIRHTLGVLLSVLPFIALAAYPPVTHFIVAWFYGGLELAVHG